MRYLFLVLALCTACNSSERDGSSLRESSDGSAESKSNIDDYEKKTAAQTETGATQGSHEDEVIVTCIARNKTTRQVYAPVMDLAAIAKLKVLEDCAVRSHKQGENPCDCEIAACSPVEAPGSIAEIIAMIVEDKFSGTKCE